MRRPSGCGAGAGDESVKTPRGTARPPEQLAARLRSCPFPIRKPCPDLRPLDAGAVVREVLRSALGMPTTDQGRTLERLAAWRQQAGEADRPADGTGRHEDHLTERDAE